MKCLVFVFACFIAVTHSASLSIGSEAEWDAYKMKYEKTYDGIEDEYRKEIWRVNLKVSA